MILGDDSIPCDGSKQASQPASVSMKEYVSAERMPSMMDTDYTANTSEVNDMEVVENEIPGLALSSQDDVLHEVEPVSPKVTTDLDDSNQDSVSNLGRTPLELAQSLSTERSEELSPGAAVTDATSTISSTATSVRLIAQLPLPKISAPVICLADEQKDQLQEMAFVRIVDAYRQVTIAGGSQVRFSILAHSGIEVNTLTYASQYPIYDSCNLVLVVMSLFDAVSLRARPVEVFEITYLLGLCK